MVGESSKSFIVRYFTTLRSRLYAEGDPIDFVSSTTGAHVTEPKVHRSIYFATLVTNLLALALPLTILQVYDRVIPNHSKETLAFLFLGLMCALVLDFMLRNVRSALLSWLSMRFVSLTSDEVVQRMLYASAGTVEKEPLAVHINRYASIGAIGDHHAGQSRMVAIDLPFVMISLVIMTFVGGVLVLVPLLLFVVFAALSIRRSREFGEVITQRSLQDNKKYDFITEVIGGILSVKAMAMEPQMQRRLERLQQAVAEITAKSIIAGQAGQSSAVLYGSVSQIIVVSIGATRVVDDHMSMGALACCTMLSGQILQPLLRVISLWTEHEALAHKRKEVDSLLHWPAMMPKERSNERIVPSIVFDNVSFSYPGQNQPVVSNANFSIAPGAVIGVQGNDGSGRSTLLNLLRGELRPSNGRVLIGGVPSDSDKFQTIKPRIGYLGAAPAIFRGTILENLTLFRSERNNLAHAMSRLIGLDRAINLLPEGFEMKLGEGIADDLPVSISQQLCIVRALVNDTQVLVLDEVNTVLDRGAEAKLIEALKYLAGGRTIFVATHRPSLLAACEGRLTIQDGRVNYSAPSSQMMTPEQVVA